MSSIFFYSQTCPISKKLLGIIYNFKLQQMFTMKQIENLTNLDLINAGVEIIPTIINNNFYHEENECMDFVMSLIQYMKYNQNSNKIVTSENMVKNDEDTCGICMGEFEVGETVQTFYCSHKFHKECSDIWRKKKNCCSICNKSLT